MQHDENTPTDGRKTEENAQNIQHVQSAAADGRPALYGRKVLSFVRRSARLDARLQRAWDTYADTYLLNINAGEGSLDVREGFVFDQAYIRETWGNTNPLNPWKSAPDKARTSLPPQPPGRTSTSLRWKSTDPGVAHTLLLAGKQNLKNLRIAQINAPELFKAAVDGSIAEVWTFFPDPWPKMRHHKRRIVQPELAADIHRALTDEGVWRIATDIEDYALHVHEVMDGLDGFHNDGALTVSLPVEHVGKGNADEAAALRHADFAESERFDGRVLTNFEKKGLAAGRVIHDFTYRRV